MRRKCFKLRLLIRIYSHCLSFNQLIWLVISMFYPGKLALICLLVYALFVLPCKDTNYNGQYNNFNAILWTFSVVLRAKTVFVKYGNCHEHSHKTLVPKKDIQVGIFPFKNRVITSHSYTMASNRHASCSQSFGQRFSPSLNIPAICTLYALLLTYNTLNTFFFLHNSQTLVFCL